MSGGDILREVDEALRVEKATQFWKDHGKTVMVLIVAVILGTAVQSGWSAYQKHQAEISTSQFLDATKATDSLSALKALSAKKDSSGSAMAGLTAAAQCESQQDWQGAIDQYANVIANKSAAPTYKDMAIVQRVAVQMDHDSKATGKDLLQSLAPVIANKKSAWYPRAVLLSAVIKANMMKDIKAAQADLDSLAALNDMPASFMDQVTALKNVYALREANQK